MDDGSGAILDEYAAKDKRFKVVHQTNAGVSAARNRGLDEAKGEWVWFVDSDDKIHPLALKWLYGMSKKASCAKTISFTTNHEQDVDCNIWPKLPIIEVSPNSIVQDHITSQGLHMHRRGVWATIVRRNIVIGKFWFYPYCVGEDVLFHLSIYLQHDTAILRPAPIYYYRIRKGSAINSKVTRRKVHDLLTTEYLMLNAISEAKAKWKLSEILEYLQWNRDWVWVTFMGMFFSLGNDEMKALLPLWIKVQRMQHSLLQDTLYRRAAVFFISLIHSPMLCRLLVFGPGIFKRKMCAALHFKVH